MFVIYSYKDILGVIEFERRPKDFVCVFVVVYICV